MATTDISSVFSITDAEDEATEYDSSSDDEICKAEDLLEESTSDLGNQQITRDIDFLVGVVDQYGSTVDSFCKVHRTHLTSGLTTVAICKDSSSLLEKDKNSFNFVNSFNT